MLTKRMMKSWLPEWKSCCQQKARLSSMIGHGIAALYTANMAGVLCQYKNFMRDVTAWEHDQQVEMVKIWLSVDESKQRELLAVA